MSHNLMRRDDDPRQAAMFPVGEAPWHRSNGGAPDVDGEVVNVPLYIASGHRLHAVAQRFAIKGPEAYGVG